MKRILFLLPAVAWFPLSIQAETTETTAPAPQYSSSNSELEASLAELKKQSETGDIAATNQVFVSYARAQLHEQAEAWFNRVVEQTEKYIADSADVQAMSYLGAQYLKGNAYFTANTEKGIELLIRACDLGDADAALLLAAHYAATNPEASQQAYAKAFAIYKKTVDTIQPNVELTQQQKEALTLMGDMELTGLGTTQDVESGIAHLEQANIAKAQLRLFQVYTNGIVVPADNAKALTYARQLVDAEADLNSTDTSRGALAWLLADSYLNGKNGVEKNEELGTKYLDIADHLNIFPAVYYKGIKLKNENKVAEAFYCFNRLASRRDPNSLMHAALILMYGAEGVEQNEALALAYMQKIADSFGHDNAWYAGRAPYELALYYDRIEQPAEADVWYRIAAERNVIEAMARKGLNHITPGNEEEWSPTLMYKWWKIGSDAGDPTCSRYLNIFLWGVIPLILIIVFGLPILTVYLLNKRAERRAKQEDAQNDGQQ